MFTVNVDEIKDKVTFSYPEIPVNLRKLASHSVACNIYKDDVLVSWDVSNCSFKDQFDKNRGRKIALGRALRKLIGRQDVNKRKLFWQGYFITRHNKV